MPEHPPTEYRFNVRPDEDGGFIAEFPDLPGCVADGETVEEAIHNSREAYAVWMDSRNAAGLPVPEPHRDRYSGRVLLRMPHSLHERLSVRAEEEGCSLNQLLVAILAGGLAGAATAAIAPRPIEYLVGRTIFGSSVLTPVAAQDLDLPACQGTVSPTFWSEQIDRVSPRGGYGLKTVQRAARRSQLTPIATV